MNHAAGLFLYALSYAGFIYLIFFLKYNNAGIYFFHDEK